MSTKSQLNPLNKQNCLVKCDTLVVQNNDYLIRKLNRAAVVCSFNVSTFEKQVCTIKLLTLVNNNTVL